jgi:imidazolonepropionase-like amidohydrolase
MGEVILFKNGIVFDGVADELLDVDVLVDGETIAEVGRPLSSSTARGVDLQGKVLMPGLIDAHVHACAAHVDLLQADRLPATFVAHEARRMLEQSLVRGFTSVRDTGGADAGLAKAIEAGLVAGPRLFFCGRALSQTGGHGDFRQPGERALCACGNGYSGHISTVVDGADAVRRVIREQLHEGAHFIKIMASGGVSSMGDSLETAQFSAEEIEAAVDESERHGTYVTAHIHPDGALRRAVELGVRHVEHGTFISDETASLARERDVAIVPTVAILKILTRLGKEQGYPAESLEKLAIAEPQALRALEVMQRAGLRTGFGTDLIGNLDKHQCAELVMRQEVLEPVEILRSATSVNAEIIGAGAKLGRVAPGFDADLIVVDGNPLTNLSLFNESGSNVSAVMKAGRFVKGATQVSER